MKTPGFIRSFPKFSKTVGLERVRAAAEPHLRSSWGLETLRAVHVVGSNGKGSTARFLSKILQSGPKKIGLFTSPHIFSFSERFEVDGVPVSSDEVEEGCERVAIRLKAIPSEFSAFEIVFLVGLEIFAQREVDILIAEAGIGGRLDPTRVLRGSVTVLTSIDLEHTELLGATEELILLDKLDIAPAGTTVIHDLMGSPQLRELANGYLQMTDRTPMHPDEIVFYDTELSNLRMRSMLRAYGTEVGSINFPASGAYQLSNCRLAMLAASILEGEDHSSSTLRRYAKSIEHTQLPLRMEILGSNPQIVLDAAHTPRAIAAYVATLKASILQNPLVCVVGISNQRNPAMLAPILALSSLFYVTQAHRGAPPNRIAEYLKQQGAHVVEVEEQLKEALKKALTKAQALEGTVIVVGGLFLAAEARAELSGMDPKAIDFF